MNSKNIVTPCHSPTEIETYEKNYTSIERIGLEPRPGATLVSRNGGRDPPSNDSLVDVKFRIDV